MNILVNGRFFGRASTGVDRFALETLKAIDQLLIDNDDCVKGLTFEILVPPGVVPSITFAKISFRSVGSCGGQRWEQTVLPWQIKQGQLLLSLCNTAPLMLRRQVVVIHDATTVRIPISYSKAFRTWYRFLMPALGKMARQIMTVSEFSRQEIARCFGIDINKISVTHNGCEHVQRVAESPDILTRSNLSQRPYVLAVSSMAAHKNFKLVLQALALLPNKQFDVAIAGGANAKVFGSAGQLDNNQVHWLGYVSDEELKTLYSKAMCFVFPSLYEGFGIPPLEAMTLGCPVLASNAASIPEVCGDAARYFDPHDAQGLAEQLNRLATDSALRQTMSEKGLQRAAQFTWLDSARKVVATCRKASDD